MYLLRKGAYRDNSHRRKGKKVMTATNMCSWLISVKQVSNAAISKNIYSIIIKISNNYTTMVDALQSSHVNVLWLFCFYFYNNGLRALDQFETSKKLFK